MAKSVLFHLWLVGSGLWAAYWLDMLMLDSAMGGHLRFSDYAGLILFAVVPPAFILLLALLLGWAFKPLFDAVKKPSGSV